MKSSTYLSTRRSSPCLLQRPAVDAAGLVDRVAVPVARVVKVAPAALRSARLASYSLRQGSSREEKRTRRDGACPVSRFLPERRTGRQCRSTLQREHATSGWAVAPNGSSLLALCLPQ